jgi:hypothetical protein
MKDEKDPRLPGAAHRDNLEELTWKAVQAAVDYSKTEDAAKDAEARLLALRVTNGLMRTELAILKAQDEAHFLTFPFSAESRVTKSTILTVTLTLSSAKRFQRTFAH